MVGATGGIPGVKGGREPYGTGGVTPKGNGGGTVCPRASTQ